MEDAATEAACIIRVNTTSFFVRSFPILPLLAAAAEAKETWAAEQRDWRAMNCNGSAEPKHGSKQDKTRLTTSTTRVGIPEHLYDWK